MDPKAPNQHVRATPEFAQYQRHNFWLENEGQVPVFNTGKSESAISLSYIQIVLLTLTIDPSKLEELVKEKLTQNGWYYASSNVGQSMTHLANRQAFFRHKILPKMLVDTNKRDTKTEIFGHKVAAPIGFAPIGINKIYNKDGELPVAKVAKELNIPYCLSTAGSQPIEAVGKANGDGPRFFQLYLPHDDELAISLLQRAHDSGFTACMMTVDTWQLGWRHDDVNTSNYAFYKGIGADLGLSDPVFQKRLKKAGIDPKAQPNKAGAMWIDNIWHGRAHTWEKAQWAMKKWKEISGGRPFTIKGIQRVDDARKCVELGFDGIVVSNHAGRQVDGAIASLDALESIVDGKHDILFFRDGHQADKLESCWR
jgi:isopentenyl diphosphate isomerase/L-lactate dehydrogenase-like FMN-dependent dehydrogenase